MPALKLTIIFLFLLVFLIVVALVVTEIGGSSIRTSGQVNIDILAISNDQVLPGTPVKFSIDPTSLSNISETTLVLLRMPKTTITLTELTLSDLATNMFTAIVPCDSEIFNEVGKDKVRFLLVNNDDNSVIAQSKLVQLLPPGPECIYSSAN